MCLKITQDTEIQVVSEDITCYKILHWMYEQKWYTPIQYTHIESGKTYTSELIIDQSPRNRYSVGVGLHSYMRLGDAKIQANLWGNDSHKVIKCTIPKGARVIPGLNEIDNRGGFASDTLVYPEQFESL